jgi:hypothetical protein
MLSDFLARFFHGSAEQLILGLVDAQELAPDDLRAIEVRLAEARRRRGDSGDESRTEPGTRPGGGGETA